jgi:hypothetical protein
MCTTAVRGLLLAVLGLTIITGGAQGKLSAEDREKEKQAFIKQAMEKLCATEWFASEWVGSDKQCIGVLEPGHSPPPAPQAPVLSAPPARHWAVGKDKGWGVGPGLVSTPSLTEERTGSWGQDDVIANVELGKTLKRLGEVDVEGEDDHPMVWPSESKGQQEHPQRAPATETQGDRASGDSVPFPASPQPPTASDDLQTTMNNAFGLPREVSWQEALRAVVLVLIETEDSRAAATAKEAPVLHPLEWYGARTADLLSAVQAACRSAQTQLGAGTKRGLAAVEAWTWELGQYGRMGEDCLRTSCHQLGDAFERGVGRMEARVWESLAVVKSGGHVLARRARQQRENFNRKARGLGVAINWSEGARSVANRELGDVLEHGLRWLGEGVAAMMQRLIHFAQRLNAWADAWAADPTSQRWSQRGVELMQIMHQAHLAWHLSRSAQRRRRRFVLAMVR